MDHLDRILLARKLTYGKGDNHVYQWIDQGGIIIKEVLGTDWCKRNIVEWKNEVLASHDTSTERFQQMDKIRKTAEYLYELRTCEGFGSFAASLQSKIWSDVLWELEVASRFQYTPGYTVKFNQGFISQGKGSDFDFSVKGPDCEYAVEAKNRRDNEDNSIRTLVNTLGNARKQLPQSSKGIIYVSIPESWNTAEMGPMVEQEIARFLRNTSRVSFVCIEFETWSDVTPQGKQRVSIGVHFSNPIEPNTLPYPPLPSPIPAYWKP